MKYTFKYNAVVSGEITIDSTSVKDALKQANEMLSSVYWRTIGVPAVKDNNAIIVQHTKQRRKDIGNHLLDVRITDRSIRAAKKQYREYRKTWRPDDCFSISVMRGGDMEHAEYVIRTTKRPFFYTFGLAYRGPITNHAAITRADALRLLARQGLLDIYATPTEVHLNEFHENDMW